MAEIQLSDEARETLDAFLLSFPAAVRQSNKTKTLCGIEYIMLKHGLRQASRETVFAGIEQCYTRSFDPIILRYKDPQQLKALAASQKQVDKNAPAVQVRRWDIPQADPPAPVESVLAFLAGPRKGGNTDCIMESLLDGVREAGAAVEKFCFSDVHISPCVGCMACEKKKLATFCAVQDDMTPLYQKFLDCDAFVLGFPVYTARECAQAAIFLDRLKALRSPGHVNRLRKVRTGALAVTWGWPAPDSYNHVIENAITIMNFFGVDIRQVVSGSGFWSAYYDKGTAALDSQGMLSARQAGIDLVRSDTKAL